MKVTYDKRTDSLSVILKDDALVSESQELFSITIEKAI